MNPDNILGFAGHTCERGRALCLLLDLLCAANLDESELDDETDEAYAVRVAAEGELFKLATDWRKQYRGWEP